MRSRRADAEALARSALGPAMLGYAEIAEYLGVSRRTAVRWTAQGVLPPPDLRFRGVVRWRAETIRRWLERAR